MHQSSQASTRVSSPSAAATEWTDAAPSVTRKRGSEIERLLDQHHALIYSFPVKVMGATEDECADFYVYAIEQIRRRKILSAEKYVEREGAKFETWLCVVLRHLYIDLKRSQREPRIDLSDSLENTAPAPNIGADGPTEADNVKMAEDALKVLKPESRVLFKLLLLNDLFLTEDDLEVLSERSGRPIPELVEMLTDLENQVGKRSMREQERQEELTRVFWWVEHYRAKLQHLVEAYGATEESWPPRISERIVEVRRKLAKRRRQHAELVRSYRAAGITVKASYEMIARVLNTTRDAVKMEAYRCRRAYLERANPDLLADEE